MTNPLDPRTALDVAQVTAENAARLSQTLAHGRLRWALTRVHDLLKAGRIEEATEVAAAALRVAT